MLLLFIRFLLIGKAFMEHRHYGGVFVLQKEGDSNKRLSLPFVL